MRLFPTWRLVSPLMRSDGADCYPPSPPPINNGQIKSFAHAGKCRDLHPSPVPGVKSGCFGVRKIPLNCISPLFKVNLWAEDEKWNICREDLEKTSSFALGLEEKFSAL